jgi:hypothetical protein
MIESYFLHADRFTKIFEGQDYHEYLVQPYDGGDTLARMKFQNGPIKEVGVNGVHVETLLAIALIELERYQDSKFSCPENADAIEHIKTALGRLNSRALDRINRGVDGTSEV